MKIVKCGKCGAQFDVAAMKPGSQFACGKCRTPVSVPAEGPPATVMLSPDQMQKALTEARTGGAPAPAASAPKSQPKLPAAMQARAAQSAGSGARAVGASAPSQPAAAVQTAAAPAPRPAAKRARNTGGDDAPPAAKPPMGLYLSISGGVLLLGLIGFMVFSGGGKETAEAPEPIKPVEAPKPIEKPKPKDPTVHDDYLTMSSPDQHDALVARVAAAGSDLAKLKELHEWLVDPKVVMNGEARAAAQRVIGKAYEIDPNCGWAHTAAGDKLIKEPLEAIKAECPQCFQRLDAEEKAVLARLNTVETQPWATGAEWAKFQDIIARIKAREERMKTDPRYMEAERKRNWVREGPMFKEVKMTWSFADPYVVFMEVKEQDVRDTERKFNDKTGEWEEVPKDGTVNPAKVRQNEVWKEKGEMFAKRQGAIFTELNRRFRELFAEEYKLPELKDKGRMLTGVVMWNRASFDKLLRAAERPVHPGIRAFYSPPEQKFFHYLGDESLQERDEIPCKGGFLQKSSDQVTYHEGTHQLQHEYSAIFRNAPLKDSDTKVDDRKAMWFEEGIAEFMGAAEFKGDADTLIGAEWRHNRILLERVREARDDRDYTNKWRIKDFLKPNDNGQLQTAGQKLAPENPGPMPSHFYCRVWGFCHFLWYYDNGKYRKQFKDYFREVMAGTQSSEKFATKIMKRPSLNDWGDVEMEYEWYWNKLLNRYVTKSKRTGQWTIADTEAPEGNVQGDPDFIEQWKENKKEEKKAKKDKKDDEDGEKPK